MPKGVEVEVGDGFATVDFVDRALKGPALARLHRIGGPDTVEVLTREGPRRKYRVPEGNARAAGLIDGAAVATPAAGATTAGDEDAPGPTWRVDDLRAFAGKHDIALGDARTKPEILDVIRKARKR